MTFIGGGGTSWKQTIWEGGFRVPAAVSWPRYIKEGRESDALISGLDILPTMASLIGFELPTDRHYDGIDLSHVLTDGSDQGHLVCFFVCFQTIKFTLTFKIPLEIWFMLKKN